MRPNGRRATTLTRLLQILTLWTLLLAAIAGAMLLPPTADAAGACTITWTGGAGTTAWAAAANWDLNRVPSSSDYVCVPDMTPDINLAIPTDTTLRGIDSAESITVNNATLTLTDASADSHLRGPVKMTGGTALIDGAGALHLYATLNWDHGTISGAGALLIESGANVNLLTSTAKELKRHVTNWGTVTFTESGGLRVASAITFTNEGTVEFPSAGTVVEATGAAFALHNNGTVKKSGTGEVALDGTLTNAGTLEVSTGVLSLPKPSTFLPGSTTNVSGQVKLTGTHTWEGSVTGTGLVFTSGTANLTLTSATTTYTVPTEIASSTGRLTIASSTSMGSLILSGGILEGAGDLTITGNLAWKSGTVQGAGKLIIAAGAQAALTTTSGKTQTGRPIENYGSINWSDGSITQSSATFTNHGTVTVIGSRQFAAASAATVGRLYNSPSGTIIKTGTGGATFDTILDNDGLVTVEEGMLSRKSSGDASETGEYRVPQNAVLEFAGGAHALNGRVTGAGKLLVSGGTVSSTAAWEIANTELTGGTLNFDAPTQIPALRLVGNATLGGIGDRRITGSMEWTQGDVAGTGPLTIAQGATLSITGAAGRNLYTTLENYGTVALTAGSFSVKNAGVLTNHSDLWLRYTGISDTTYLIAKLVNHGTVTKDAGTSKAVLDGTLENRGIISVSSGILGLRGNLTDVAEATLRADAGGTIHFVDGGTHSVSGSVTGAGTVIVHTAKVTFAGPYTVATTRLTGSASYPTIWTGAPALPTLEIKDGTAQFDVNASVDHLLFSSGHRTGTGTVTVNNAFAWSAGYIHGAGTTVIADGATAEISGNTSRELKNGHTLTNKGTLVWKSGGISYGTGSVFNNDGSLEIQGDVIFARGQGVLDSDLKLNNRGTIAKTGGTGTAAMRGTFDNEGTISVSSGTLQFDGVHAAEEGGKWTAQAGGTLLFSGGGTRNLTGEVGGPGTIDIDFGTTSLAQTLTVGTFRQDGGTTNLAGTPNATLFHLTSGTVNVNGDLTAATLKMDGNSAYLNVPAGRTVSVTQSLIWNGGTFKGAGTTTLAASTQSLMEGSVGKYLREGHTLNNLGTIIMKGTSFAGESAVLNNAGTITIEADFKIERAGSWATPGRWNNTGTIRKTAGTGRNEVSVVLDNDGTVDVQTGTLAFIAGGAGESTGSYTVGGTLELDGVHTIGAGGSITGGGTFRVLAGTTTINGTYNVTTTEVTGSGTVATFKGATTVPYINVYGASPKAVFEVPVSPLAVSVTASGTAVFKQNVSAVRVDLANGGTLDLPGATMTVTQQFNWTGGVLMGAAGTARILAGAEWLLSGTAGKYLEDGIHVINQGNATWTAGNFEYSKGPTLTNEGLFDVQGDLMLKREYYGSGASLQINNKGTFRKSQGAGMTTISAGFDNDGAVEVATGTLGLILGGGSDETGTFAVNGTLELAADSNTSHNLAASASISGPGTLRASASVVNVAGSVDVGRVEVTGGTATFSGPVTTPALSVSGGTLNLTRDLTTATFTQSGGTIVPANLTVTSTYRWSGGISAGSAGTTLIPSGAQMLIETTAQKNFYGPRTLRNEGTIIYSGAALYHGSNPLLENVGTFDITGDGAIDGPYGCCSEWKTTNTGTIVKSGGTGTSKVEIVLTTPGTVRVLSGILHIDDRFPVATGNATTPGVMTSGTYEIAAGSALRIYNLYINTNQASISLTGPGATFATGTGANALANLTQNSGTITLSGGATLTASGALTNTGTITVGGGSTIIAGLTNQGLLTGSGTVQGDVLNQAQITPGGAGPGILTVDGAFANGSGGLIAIDLGGTAAGTNMDQLRVTGNALLNGTLATSLLGEYQPEPGDTFQVLVYGTRSGQFATITGPGEVSESYNPTDLTLLLGATELTVVSTDPFNGQTDVPVNKTIVVNFSEAIAAGPGLSNITLTKNGEPVAATVTLDNKSLFIDPAADLTHKQTFTLTLPADAVRAATGLGELSEAYLSSFTTINDRILPVWPAGAAISATPTETTLSLTWTAATDNVGVEGYRLTVDTGAPILTNTNAYTLTGLAPDKEYSLKVEARDAEGNWTVSSLTLKPRTLDQTPPTWPNASLTVSNLGAGSLSLAWTAAADLGSLKEYIIYQNGQQIGTVNAGSGRNWDVKNLEPETLYTFQVQALDRVGNKTQDGPTASATTKADTTPPAWTGTNYLNAANHTTTTIDLSWTAASDDVRVTGYRLFVNGSYYTTVSTNSYKITGLTPGTRYRFQVFALDAAGHVSAGGPVLDPAATLGDVTPPVWPVGAQLNVAGVGNNTASLTWPAAADETWVKHYKLHMTPAGGTTTTYTETATAKAFTSLTPDTTYEFRLEAIDQAGNASETLYATVLTTVDTEAPTWPAGAALTVSNRTETGLRLSWPAASDNVGVSAYRVRMDNNTHTTTGSTYADFTGLNPGQTYTFAVEAGDGAGHWTAGPTLAASPLADTKAPAWPNGAAISAANVTESSMDLAWPAAGDNVKVTQYRLYVNGGYKTTILPGTGATITYALTGLTPASVYDLKVEAGDEKGNWSANGPTASFVTKGDNQAPTWPEGSTLTYTGLSHDSVLLTWSAAQDNARVSKYEIIANGSQSVATVGPTVSTYLVKGLSPLTAYTFQVKAGDDNNNWSSGGPSVSLTTPAQPSPAIPVWPAGAALNATFVGETSVTLTWPAATDDVAVTEYILYLNGSEIRRTSAATLTTTVDGLLADRTYRFKVEANDADSHITTNGPFAEVTTDDNTAPTWAAGAQLTVENLAAGSLKLTWPGATDNGSLKGYRVLQGQLLLGEPGAGTTHLNVTGLLPNQPYTFTVLAADRAGNWTPTGLSLTITTPPDTTAPTWNPVSLTAQTIAETEIALTWGTARDDIGVTGYRLFQDGAQIAETTAQGYTVTGLTRATLYNFRVEAADASGNWSTTGPRLAVATAGDDVPPVWPDGAAITVVTRLDKSVTFSWPAATDNLAVKHYAVTANGQTLTTNQTAITIEGLSPGATYTITVTAVDPSGNQTATPLAAEVTTTIDPTAPAFPEGSVITFSNVAVTSLRFDWPAATDNLAVTYYRVTVNDQVLTSSEDDRFYILTNLLPGTLYQVKVEARDAAGNWSQPLTGEITTPADVTAPTWPAGAALSTSAITETAMTLTWGSATDDVGVTGYKVTYNGQSVEVTGNTYTVTGLTAATVYTFKVEARDAAGNWSSTGPGTVMTTRGDHEAPTWPGGSLYLVAATKNSIQLGWTAAADNARVAQYRIYMEDAELVTLNAGVSRFTVTDLPDSTAYDFRIEAVDDNGNWSANGPTLTAATLDVTAPNWPAGAALTAIQTAQDTVLLDWSAAADKVGVTGYQVFMGDTPVGAPVSGLTTTVSGLNVLYTYNFKVEALDAAGNRSATGPTAQITIADITAPTWLGAVDVADGETTATVAWDAATDNVGVEGYKIRFGDTVYTTTETTYTFTGLTPGQVYEVSIWPFDAAGNEGAAANATARPRDITPPSWPVTPTVTVDDVTETTVTLSWTPAAYDTVTANPAYRIYRNGSLVAESATTAAIVTGLTPYTEYSFTIRPIDAWANEGADSPAATVRTLDLTPPAWADGALSVSNLTATSLTLTWPAATDLVGVTGYEIFQGAQSLGTVTGLTYTVTGLRDVTTYTFSVRATDASFNWSAPLSVTVTTPDGTAPTWPSADLTVTGLSETELTLHWTDATDNVGVTGYAIYMDDVQVGTSASATYGVGGLSAGQTYTFKIKAVDAAGNWSSFGPSATVTTPDQTAPYWTGGALSVGAVTETTVALSWSGAADNLGVTGYRIFIDGAGAADVTGTSHTVTGLNLGQTYTFKVEALDAAGNISADGPTAVATTRDVTAPTFGRSRITVQETSESIIHLMWDAAADNLAVAEYRLMQNGAAVGFTSGTDMILTGLTPAATYTFSVQARDAAGNWSSDGPSLTYTMPDHSAPVWPAGSTLLVVPVDDDTVQLQWPGASDVALAGYLVDGTFVAGNSFTVDGLTPATAYTFSVVAVDQSGNRSGALTASYTTPAAPDTAAPTWPDGAALTGSTGETWVSLTWSPASDDVGVTGYLVNGVMVTGTTFQVTGLTPNTEYTFTVVAVDAAGNQSGALTVTLRTRAPRR